MDVVNVRWTLFWRCMLGGNWKWILSLASWKEQHSMNKTSHQRNGQNFEWPKVLGFIQASQRMWKVWANELKQWRIWIWIMQVTSLIQNTCFSIRASKFGMSLIGSYFFSESLGLNVLKMFLYVAYFTFFIDLWNQRLGWF